MERFLAQPVYGIRTQNVYGFRTPFFRALNFRRLDREAFEDAGAASAGRARGQDRTGLGGVLGKVLMRGSGGIDRDVLGRPKMHYSGSQERSSGGPRDVHL